MKTTMDTHSIEVKHFTGDAIKGLRALDYDNVSLSELTYEMISVSGEPESYKWGLKNAFMANRIIAPIIVLARPKQPLLLVEGHHRAVLAMEANMPLHGELHRCNCSFSDLDSFGLCKIIWNSCKSQKTNFRNVNDAV